jgi:hypothetical protein
VAGGAGYLVGENVVQRIDLGTHRVAATNDTDVTGALLDIGKGGLYMGSPTGGVSVLDPTTLELRQSVVFDTAVAADGSKWQVGLAGVNGGIRADDTGAWVRFSAPVLGRVTDGQPTGTLYGGPFPTEWTDSSAFTVADGSLWLTNIGDGGNGNVYRVALPTP